MNGQGKNQSGLGDMPEDRNWFWREAFPQLMRDSLGKGVKESWLGDERDNLGAMLLRLAENYMMPAQHIVPVFARPLKITTEPPNGIELPPGGAGPIGPTTFYNGLTYRVPDNCAAVITSLHQELESPAAYQDVNIRLFYRLKGSNQPGDVPWHPRKPEASPVRITIFQQEKFGIQWENNGIITHFLKAEILGYVFGIVKPSKSQRGLTTVLQSQG